MSRRPRIKTGDGLREGWREARDVHFSTTPESQLTSGKAPTQATESHQRLHDREILRTTSFLKRWKVTDGVSGVTSRRKPRPRWLGKSQKSASIKHTGCRVAVRETGCDIHVCPVRAQGRWDAKEQITSSSLFCLNLLPNGRESSKAPHENELSCFSLTRPFLSELSHSKGSRPLSPTDGPGSRFNFLIVLKLL